mgnify:CR=1 FL=1
MSIVLLPVINNFSARGTHIARRARLAIIQACRDSGFQSVNVDLIYGLPKQTPESFARTLQQVAQLRPDRIALYGYAHLPERFKPQRRILGSELPPVPDKVTMLSQSLNTLQEAGYVYIGMDHFALPDDSLAVAKRQGRLHRNFQGYSTQPDCDLIGLGVSAIGKVGATYSQNAKTMEEYCDALDHGQLPVNRGLALSRDDLARRAQLDARDLQVVRGDRQPAHHVEAHRLRRLHEARALAVRAVEVN